jgi:hypothetical protein
MQSHKVSFALFLLQIVPMDIPATIAIRKAAISFIVSGLFAVLRLVVLAGLGRVPLPLHRGLARVLLTAKSALRPSNVALAC